MVMKASRSTGTHENFSLGFRPSARLFITLIAQVGMPHRRIAPESLEFANPERGLSIFQWAGSCGKT
jgi:hypothetical protein